MRNSFLLLSGFHTWVCMCKSYLNSFSLYSKGLYLFTTWIFIPLFVKNMSTFVNRGINTLKPKPVIPMEGIADKHTVKKIWLSELEWKELTFLLLSYYFVLSLIYFCWLDNIFQLYMIVEEYLGTWEANIAFQLDVQLVFCVWYQHVMVFWTLRAVIHNAIMHCFTPINMNAKVHCAFFHLFLLKKIHFSYLAVHTVHDRSIYCENIRDTVKIQLAFSLIPSCLKPVLIT